MYYILLRVEQSARMLHAQVAPPFHSTMGTHNREFTDSINGCLNNELSCLHSWDEQTTAT